MTAPATASSTTLNDGRRLAWLAVGPPDGVLVVYLHGAIGSPPAVGTQLEAAVEELGIRYVMVGRPGFGGSDALPGRTLRQFAGDVAQLADALGHARFAVVGVSAGGPYALACAHDLPERVAVASVVSCTPAGGCVTRGLPAPARLGLRGVRARPSGCARTGDMLVRLARRKPALLARVMLAGAARRDRSLLDAPDARALAAQRFLAASSAGVAGMIDDYVLCSRPWGFDAARVAVPVQLWHGMQDALVSVDHAYALAATLPRVEAAICSDEGHFFYERRLPEILGAIVAVAAPASTRSSSSVDQPNPRAPSPCPVSGW